MNKKVKSLLLGFVCSASFEREHALEKYDTKINWNCSWKQA